MLSGTCISLTIYRAVKDRSFELGAGTASASLQHSKFLGMREFSGMYTHDLEVLHGLK